MGKLWTLWLQLESVDAVKNCRKFAKPGVDCLSFGPADLSFSLENTSNHNFNPSKIVLHLLPMNFHLQTLLFASEMTLEQATLS
ncbi:MAG: hypothetical protein CM1200mP7_0030 [Chloroflexota bacterium]|nr:MAG: hypothetical protein CM1200mP7_0030 [Chloroflexota bacterium]